jgi:hypothetical protein
MTESNRMAPSSINESALRRLAKRRGYKVRKFRDKDWYYLIDIKSGMTTVANDHAPTEEERYFSKYMLVEFLRSMPINGANNG